MNIFGFTLFKGPTRPSLSRYSNNMKMNLQCVLWM